VDHSWAYATAWESFRLSGYDSFSEIPRDELDGEECKANVVSNSGKKKKNWRGVHLEDDVLCLR